MFVREIRVGVRKREFCVCERETVVGKGSGSRSCVCERESERGEFVWSVNKRIMSVWDGDEKETATNVVSTGERERE